MVRDVSGANTRDEKRKHSTTVHDQTTMQLDINTNGELVLSNVYPGIGIKTDDGLFGIAQRDFGIEVMLDGRHVWQSDDRNPPTQVSFAIARSAMARGINDDAALYVAYHANVAMVMADSGVDLESANDLAAKILNLVFGSAE